MKKSINTKKIFKEFRGVSFKRYIPRKIENIWFVIIMFFMLLVIAMLVWSSILFAELSRGDVGASFSPDAADTKAINRKQLEDLLDTLTVRKEVFKTLTSVEIPEEERGLEEAQVEGDVADQEENEG